MKKIAIIAFEKSHADFIKEELSIYLDKFTQIYSYSLQEVECIETIHVDCIVLSASTVFKNVERKIKDNTILHVVQWMLNYKNIEELKAIPKGTKAMLVNYDYRTSMEVITQVYEAGIKHLELVPCHDPKFIDKSIKVAITPDEMSLVPDWIEIAIDIGTRSIDVNNIIELADKIGIKNILRSAEVKTQISHILQMPTGLERLLGENEDLRKQIKVIIEFMEEGIILTDSFGVIYIHNEKASILLKNKGELTEGFLMSEILPELCIDDWSLTFDETEQTLDIQGENLILSIASIHSEDGKRGNIIRIRSFEELENRQHGIRTKLSGKKHLARYSFEDIKGESVRLSETITVAERIAKSESAVFITGESGTGKEVFAQSIHNASSRKKYNFVAVNCSAIPENLLESEMFGYEEGAFTGARKNGKIGYFELAHKGTLFLDEIGEMPLSLQSKLLRALEEKKISKIGSLNLIDVDVRIIAATNRNVRQLISEKVFREDLYYRLGVLPLEIPSLRERKEDILMLLRHFMERMDEKFILSEETLTYLENYHWPGNIRELNNVAEYLSSLEKDYINTTDLPTYLLKVEKGKDWQMRSYPVHQDAVNHIRFILKEGTNIYLLREILMLMKKYDCDKKRCGRGSLVAELTKSEEDFTEAEIRTGLRKLSESGFVHSKVGRGGSRITPEGLALLEGIIGLLG